MIPQGVWKARGCSAVLGRTQTTNRPQVGIDLLILEGPATGSHITWYGYFGENSFDRTIESLRLLGWGGADLNDLRGIGDTEVMVVVDHEPDQSTGELRARAQWINALGGVAMKNRMDDGEAKAFAASMKGRILALGAAGPRPTGGTRAPAAPGGIPPAEAVDPDDNIPF